MFQALIEGVADLSEERRQLSLMGTRAPDQQISEEGQSRRSRNKLSQLCQHKN